MIQQFIKFCVVGGSGVFIDFGRSIMKTPTLPGNTSVSSVSQPSGS